MILKIDLLSFVIIEIEPASVDFLLPLKGYEKFKAQRPFIEETKTFNPGLTPIKKKNILRLLEYAHNRGEGLKVMRYDPNGLGTRFYLVIGKFDIKIRREMVK